MIVSYDFYQQLNEKKKQNIHKVLIVGILQ